MIWKLQRNKKGQFTGLLVNENGETKTRPRDKNGKFIKQETYKPIDYKFPEIPVLPELNWKLPVIEFPVFPKIHFEFPVLPTITSDPAIGKAFIGDVSSETLFTEQDIIEAYKAGLNSHRNSFILPTRQAELYMVGIHAEKKSMAQRKV